MSTLVPVTDVPVVSSVEYMRKRSSKRKTAAEGEGSSRKKKRSPDLKGTKEETKEDLSVDARRGQ